MQKLEYIRNKIKQNGYMTETQIILNLSLDGYKHIDKLLKSITDIDGFHKMLYTNTYVSMYTMKTLYYYNPNKKKRVKRKKQTKKKVT